MYKNKKHTSSYNTSTYQHDEFSSILFIAFSLFQVNETLEPSKIVYIRTFQNILNSYLGRGSPPCFDPDYL